MVVGQMLHPVAALTFPIMVSFFGIPGLPATAQRGALDWAPKFKKATLPVFKDLYKAVKTGKEAARVLRVCGKADYANRLGKELGGKLLFSYMKGKQPSASKAGSNGNSVQRVGESFLESQGLQFC